MPEAANATDAPAPDTQPVPVPEPANAGDASAPGTQAAPEKADAEQGAEQAQSADAPATTDTEAPKAPTDDEPVLAPSAGALAPGGGLDAHEAAGGHLLAKHVGKTEQELIERFKKDPRIKGSSSFFSQAHAEEAAAATVKANDAKITSWLATNEPELVITGTMNEPVGLKVARGATSATRERSVKFVLRRDARSPLGYFIRTGVVR